MTKAKRSFNTRLLSVTGVGLVLGFGIYAALPAVGMSTALLILPVLSLMNNGWLAAATASSIMTALSFVGVSMIDYAPFIAPALGIALAPLAARMLNAISKALHLPSLFNVDSTYGLIDYLSDLLHPLTPSTACSSAIKDTSHESPKPVDVIKSPSNTGSACSIASNESPKPGGPIDFTKNPPTTIAWRFKRGHGAPTTPEEINCDGLKACATFKRRRNPDAST